MYISNGPTLVTSGPHAGTLDFENYTDINGGKAVGGRLGFRPIAGLEFGYGVEFADAAPSGSGFGNVNVLTQSVDVAYQRTSELLKGRIDMRAQFLWLNIDNPGIGPLDFTNDSDGGYVQMAYRPTEASSDVVNNLEPVIRYDWINQPMESAERMSVGLNYWINDSTVIKASYEWRTDKEDGESVDSNGVRLQAAIGF